MSSHLSRSGLIVRAKCHPMYCFPSDAGPPSSAKPLVPPEKRVTRAAETCLPYVTPRQTLPRDVPPNGDSYRCTLVPDDAAAATSGNQDQLCTCLRDIRVSDGDLAQVVSQPFFLMMFKAGGMLPMAQEASIAEIDQIQGRQLAVVYKPRPSSETGALTINHFSINRPLPLNTV